MKIFAFRPVRFCAFALALAAFTPGGRAGPVADSPTNTHPDFEVTVTGRGRPVLFIPGLATPGTIWQPVVDQLKATCQCHVLSLAGFGGVPPTGTNPFLVRVRDEIIGYVHDAKLDHPVIVGHSMGGMMALWLAETAPELPGRLVIVDAMPFQAAIMNPTATEESARASIAPRVALYARASRAEFVAEQQKLAPQWVASADLATQIVAENGRSDPKTVSRALSELVSMDLREELGKVRCPVLVLGSLADKVVHAPRDEIIRAFHLQYAGLAGVRFEMFDGARHFIMVDDPAGFQKALDGELAEK